MELSNFPTFPLFLLFVRREQLDSLGSVLTSKTPSYIKYSRVFYLLQERNLPFFRELANLLFFLLDKLLALISSLGATLNLPSLPPLPRHPRPDSRLLFLPFILSFRFRLHVLALVPRLLATPLNLLPQQSPSLPHDLHARTFERVQHFPLPILRRSCCFPMQRQSHDLQIGVVVGWPLHGSLRVHHMHANNSS
jgi:hypothetical protein